MLIFYADECGTHEAGAEPGVTPPRLRSGVSERFILAAVGVRDVSRRPLAEAIIRLKRSHFGDAVDGPWGDTEIKGRFLSYATRGTSSAPHAQPPGGYERLDSGKVGTFIRQLGLLLAKFRPLIFATVVDKNEMHATDSVLPPIGVAYSYLQSRIAIAMEDMFAGEAAIIVADQQGEHEAFFRTGKLHEVRAALTDSLHRKPNYDLVLDKPLWVDTDLSIWDREIIQLADIVAYSVNEFLVRGTAPQEPNYLWTQIQSCFAVHFATGHVLGAGISVYPKTATLPAI